MFWYQGVTITSMFGEALIGVLSSTFIHNQKVPSVSYVDAIVVLPLLGLDARKGLVLLGCPMKVVSNEDADFFRWRLHMCSRLFLRRLQCVHATVKTQASCPPISPTHIQAWTIGGFLLFSSVLLFLSLCRPSFAKSTARPLHTSCRSYTCFRSLMLDIRSVSTLGKRLKRVIVCIL